jgi:hypothetical protein
MRAAVTCIFHAPRNRKSKNVFIFAWIHDFGAEFAIPENNFFEKSITI